MSENKNKHYYLSILGTGLAIVLSLLVSTNSFASTYSLSLTSSGSQNIDVSGSGDMTAISSDSVNVSTTCRYGYNFTINTSVSDNNLYLNGNSANNTSDTYFTPTNGTATLKNNPNAWGYYYNDSAPTTAPTSSNIFSPVPALGNTATIKSPLASQSNTDINDSFNIYYGVASSNSIPVGNYKMIPDTNNSNNNGTIVYTATIADACTQYTVQFSPTSEFEGNTLTGTGTMNDQTIYEGIATALTTNGFTAPSGYYFVGWNTEQDGSGAQYTNGQQITDLTTAGSSITLYAMWTDCPANRICYSPNVSNPSDVVGEMGNQSVSSFATLTVLYAPNFSRANYGFEAWNTNPNGTGTNYGPNQTIKFNAGAYSTGGLKLYAKWIASAGNMQSFSASDCNAMNVGDVTARKDTRDNNVYAIAKLADNKCWMIENLRLADKDSSNNDIVLSSTNTHNPSLPLTNDYANSTTSNHLSPTTNPTTTAWCTTDSSACDDQSMLATNNTTLFTSNTASSYSASSNVYSYGNYYNWYSATGGHGKYGSSYGDGYHSPGDICPAGWHLPKGANKTNEANNEFWSLIVTGLNNGVNPANYDNYTYPYYNGTEATPVSNALRSYPNNFVYSGYANGSSVYDRYSYGFYWSASGFGGGNAYRMSFSSTYVYPGTNGSSKYGGRMVRCVAGV